MSLKIKLKNVLFKTLSFAKNLKLGFELAKRELKERYIGTNFGHLWLIISPLVNILIYTLIFSDFMKIKLSISSNKYIYSIYLIPGIFSWNFFANVVMRSSNILFEKSSVIKKVNVPIYSFYISAIVSESIVYFIGMTLGSIFVFLVTKKIPVSFLFIPFLMFIFAEFTLAFSVIISLFTPFFKDLKEIIGVFLQIWFWITPIVYVRSMLNKYHAFLIINPLNYFIFPLQDIFVYNRIDKSMVLVSFLISIFLLSLMVFLYKKMIDEIKDIL